jgi:hypothetical protein
MTTERKKGHFTFRTAAVLLIASAVLELLSVTSEVPLFDEVRGGIEAVIYHLVYAGLFLVLGVGLWRARKWGYTLVFVTTAIYTLDKLQLVLGRQALDTFIKAQFAGYESQLQSQGIDTALIMQAVVLMAVVVVLCWWGFALYTWWRRDYFRDIG